MPVHAKCRNKPPQPIQKGNTLKTARTTVAIVVLFCFSILARLAPARTPQEIAQNTLASTVLVTMTNASGQTSYGSGFVVGAGQVATNLHVINDITSGKVKLVGTTVEHAIESVLIVDINRDLAILKASSLTASALTLGDSDTIQIGQSVYAAGNPQGLTGTFSQGIISAIRPDGNTFVKDTIIQMTAPVSPGSSGGPVLNEDSEVIGIVFSQVTSGQNLNFIIPVNALKTLISELASNRLVNIPDPHLLRRLIYGFDKIVGSPIHAFEMESLTWIRANNYNIISLTGLESATNLTWIDFGAVKIGSFWVNSNAITDVSPLAGLTQLTDLDLDENAIVDISALANLTNLEYLDLWDNAIVDISALAGMTQLKELYLAYNEIADVSSLKDLTNLEKLFLKDNPITDASPLCVLQEQAPTLHLDIDILCGPFGLFMQDFNGDDQVDLADVFFLLVLVFASGVGGDFNNDGSVNFLDLVAAAESLTDSTTVAAPQFPLAQAGSPDTVRLWIDIAHAADDGSVEFQEGIANLERFLAAMQPDQTELLPNYPNPFNPETWIPYHLASDADVAVTIYDATGTVVRRLDLGYQEAGYYTDKADAAYWDGQNRFGEIVGSGIYFYRLDASGFSATRKLTILK